MDQLEQEFTKALAEGRQPNCIYCGKPLEVYQAFSECTTWVWDKSKKKYEKVDGCQAADKPECESCGARNWKLVGFLEAGKKLGLDY